MPRQRHLFKSFAKALIFLLCALPALAQETPRVQTPLALAELRNELRFFDSIARLLVSFKSLKVLKDLKIQLSSEGSLLVERPHKVVWKITKPAPLTATLTEHQIELVSGQGQERQTQTFNLDALAGTSNARSITALVSWLKLDADQIYALYDTVRLAPKRFRFETKDFNSSPIQALEAELGQQGEIKTLVIYEMSGDEMRITFGKPKVSRKKSQ